MARRSRGRRAGPGFGSPCPAADRRRPVWPRPPRQQIVDRGAGRGCCRALAGDRRRHRAAAAAFPGAGLAPAGTAFAVAGPRRLADSRGAASGGGEMTSGSEIAFASAEELVALYRTKALSPVEAAQALFERLDMLQPRLNAFCVVDR